MTDEIFEQQMKVIFKSEVFTYPIDDINYLTYSQAVPPDAKERKDIDFYLIMLIEESVV